MARRYQRCRSANAVGEGEFACGGMQPKVEAIVDFINAEPQQGERASGLITSPQTVEHPGASSGTWITL
ncbi:hypothetical protein ACNKHM_11725 [Shigella sonnei]